MRNVIKTIRINNRHMDKTLKVYEWSDSLIKAFEDGRHNGVGTVAIYKRLGDIVNDLVILNRYDMVDGTAYEWFISKNKNEYSLHFVIARDAGNYFSCRYAGECAGIIRAYRRMKRKIYAH
jgi:hypothetical protein